MTSEGSYLNIKHMVATFTKLRKRRQLCWGKDNKFNSVPNRLLVGDAVKEAEFLLSGAQEKEMRCYVDLRLYVCSIFALIEHIDFN